MASETDGPLPDLLGELDSLSTESYNETYRQMDTLRTAELVAAMNAEDAGVAAAVGETREAIVSAVDGISARLADGGRLIYLGAGTPGRLGVLDAAECPPTFGTDPGMVLGIIAGGPGALVQAVEGAEDSESFGARDLEHIHLTARDAVVGISASGRTPYVRGGLEFARREGALTVAVACNADSAIGRIADVAIEVVVGAEFINGSTRLKSGTAQKMVCNMLSTLSMVRLGKTYGNLMVDLQASNAKLLARSQRLVMLASGCSESVAASALHAADGEVKLAILMLVAEVDATAARAALEANKGFLRQAIASFH
ncbi:N-acetylmuramic acid 6-phosphate etherase [Saxibacter everestensis]|uniref:N-acetylmuramic acid 6-phosphate etherase n=1 Tax=Saxibacter everestensis TaxID=2909229 RepID=A0ABY8QXZ7_9MICO|nr:N-acetylmuramic acid 6-phosphate etherase [Brevibacteriaceae bacterium ZFBP1038]